MHKQNNMSANGLRPGWNPIIICIERIKAQLDSLTQPA